MGLEEASDELTDPNKFGTPMGLGEAPDELM